MVGTMKQLLLAAATLAALMGCTTAADFGVLRGHTEDTEMNDFTKRMSAAAAKESARSLLRKWLLNDKAEEKVEAVPEVKLVVEEQKAKSINLPWERKDEAILYIKPSIIALPSGDAPHGRNLQTGGTFLECYYIPFPEQQLIETFVTLSDGVNGTIEAECDPAPGNCTNVETFISIVISFDDTIIRWDHWEDGYNMTDDQNTTEIWGDRDCLNGFRPFIGSVEVTLADCLANPDLDSLNQGDAVVINNIVELNRDPSQFFYDGGDEVKATALIKVVRGGFAESTGPLLAGAVEVYEQSTWGTFYVCPIGDDTIEDSIAPFDPFNTTSIYVMAGTDDTTVTYTSVSDGVVTVFGPIDMGDSLKIDGVGQGDTIETNNPVQFHVLTGENGFPWYELRWYGILPLANWANDYYSPVGLDDGTKQTMVWCFNPNVDDLVLTYEFVGGVTTTMVVEAGTAMRTEFAIPTGSGVRVYSGEGLGDPNEPDIRFYCLTQTDIEQVGAANNRGQREDWGHALIPARDGTAQVTCGIGWGCPEQRESANMPCSSFTNDRNETVPVSEVVWITPILDATCFVSYNGSGIVDDTVDVDRLESYQFIDEIDNDLSGALIWCVEQGEGPNGDGVPFFAAWGQNPLLTGGVFGLDAGYGLLGDVKLRPSKGWELKNRVGSSAYVGEYIVFTHTVLNTGYSQFGRGRLRICDEMPPELVYVEGTAVWETYLSDGSMYESGMVNTSDTNFGDLFGENCFSLPSVFPPRGGKLTIVYEAMASNSDNFPEYALVVDDPSNECYYAINKASISYNFDRRTKRELDYKSETPICYKCVNEYDDEVDPGCNTTYPNCDAPDSYWGPKCLPPTTTTTTPGPNVTVPIPPPKPPCNPTTCQACWYFCGIPGEHGYTCGDGYYGTMQTNLFVRDGKKTPPGACKVHDFCVYCGYVCPDKPLPDDECPVGCPSDPNHECPSTTTTTTPDFITTLP